MRVSLALSLTLVCASLAAPGAFARAAGPTGVWNRDDGLGGVRIARCGDALCGHVVWLRDPSGPAYIGQKVLFGMRATAANTWTGSAHNPEDGGTYAGTMVLAGDRMTTRGCALGGLVCKSVGLTRARR